MNKHTPGPWISHKADDLHGHDHFVMTASGFLGYLPKESEGGGVQLFTEQDARLIAAAPELLEALIAANAELEMWRAGFPNHSDSEEVAVMIDEAISKATGESA